MNHRSHLDSAITTALRAKPVLLRRWLNVLETGRANAKASVRWRATFKKAQDTARKYREAHP